MRQIELIDNKSFKVRDLGLIKKVSGDVGSFLCEKEKTDYKGQD
jgi:hypothetical protein